MRGIQWLLVIFTNFAGAEEIRTSLGGQPFVVQVPDLSPDRSFVVRLVGDPDEMLTGAIAIGASGSGARDIADAYALQIARSLPSATVLVPQPGTDHYAAVRALPSLVADPRVRWSEPVIHRRHALRLTPTDPKFSAFQWQLRADALNLETVWDRWTGTGIRIAIADSGVKIAHEDLAANCVPGWDLLGGDQDPTPVSLIGSAGDDPSHGTAVAGVAAAAANDKGGIGVAFGADVVPLRLIGASETSAMAADALAWGLPGHIPAGSEARPVDVINNSWGPEDNGIDRGPGTENPSSLELDALDKAVSVGRDGKGTVIVFACGNGGPVDTCDRDGYASNRAVLAVGSTNFLGRRSDYSERGACLFICAPVGDNTAGASTKDLGAVVTGYTALASGSGDDYARELGTSFSAPMVSGVVALMLQANPELTWRDVRHILAMTARQTDPLDANWITNGAGLHWNLNYGFGEVDAADAVTAAEMWTNVPPAATPLTASLTGRVEIPDNGAAAPVSLSLSADPAFRAEWVELTVDAEHPYQGDLAFTLTSPRGTTVNFLARPVDNSPARRWTFTSVATWNEWPDGIWTVVAHDVATGDTGALTGLALTVYGYGATTDTAPGTGTAIGTSTLLAVGGTKTMSGTTNGAGGVGGGGGDSGGGGGGCGVGGGVACILTLTGLALARGRRTLRG